MIFLHVRVQLSLQPEEASAPLDPKSSPRMSRANIFFTQFMQVKKQPPEEELPKAALLQVY